MSDEEEIVFLGTHHKIKLAPLTLLFHNQIAQVEMPARIVLDPEVTVHHGGLVKRTHPRTSYFTGMVFGNEMPEKTSLAYRHVLGLIDLSLKLSEQGVKIAWRYPETYLHPKFQCCLADVAIRMFNLTSGTPDEAS